MGLFLTMLFFVTFVVSTTIFFWGFVITALNTQVAVLLVLMATVITVMVHSYMTKKK